MALTQLDLAYATPQRARAIEKEGRWLDAAEMWKRLGFKTDEDACRLILESTERGDEFRNRVERLCGVEPDKTENPHAWVKWYNEMREIKL